EWAKNLFLYIPLFFAGEIFNWLKVVHVFEGFLAFCCIASSIYIINDYADKDDDKKHPEKRNRPIASGAVSAGSALTIFAILTGAGFFIAYFISTKFFFLLGLYFSLNIGYSFGLKNIPILDIFIIAIGFALRVRSGGSIAKVDVTIWLNIMVFLLALFMAAGKRRDDALLYISSWRDMRKFANGYTLDYLNALLLLISAVMIVAYLMQTMSERVIFIHSTKRLYVTFLFVMAGIMRYLQIIYVN